MLNKIEYIDQLDIKKEVSILLENAFPIDERPPTKYFFKSLEKRKRISYLRIILIILSSVLLS